MNPPIVYEFFFFNDTATTEIYTLSLHDALPISVLAWKPEDKAPTVIAKGPGGVDGDRKSTRLKSSHSQISYAVFCLQKKNSTTLAQTQRLTPQTRAPHPFTASHLSPQGTSVQHT